MATSSSRGNYAHPQLDDDDDLIDPDDGELEELHLSFEYED